jgi:hypothetical protein
MTNPVKWIGDDGGWKVGEIVRDLEGQSTVDDNGLVLIREAHCGTLTWVDPRRNITPYVVTPEFK